jgi:hypothetical protein
MTQPFGLYGKVSDLYLGHYYFEYRPERLSLLRLTRFFSVLKCINWIMPPSVHTIIRQTYHSVLQSEGLRFFLHTLKEINVFVRWYYFPYEVLACN